MTGKQIGYIRVSTALQNTDRQLDGIDLDKIFEEKVSAKDSKRPQLQAMLDYIREGDVIHVHSMDRLARSLTDLMKIVEQVCAKNVKIRFEKDNMEFCGDDDARNVLVLQIMGAVAQFERSIILERQREGIALAKAAGKYKGKKFALNDEQVAELKQMKADGAKVPAIMKHFGIKQSTVYKYLKADQS